MPENNEPQYELDKDYAPLGIVDAADGSGTTWPEFVEQLDKMDNQVAALTEVCDSQSQELTPLVNNIKVNLTTTGNYAVVSVKNITSNVLIDGAQLKWELPIAQLPQGIRPIVPQHTALTTASEDWYTRSTGILQVLEDGSITISWYGHALYCVSGQVSFVFEMW